MTAQDAPERAGMSMLAGNGGRRGEARQQVVADGEMRLGSVVST